MQATSTSEQMRASVVQPLLVCFFFVAIFRLHANICMRMQTIQFRSSFVCVWCCCCCFCVTRIATLISITIAFCVCCASLFKFYFYSSISAFTFKTPFQLKLAAAAVYFNAVHFLVARFFSVVSLSPSISAHLHQWWIFFLFSCIVATNRDWNVVCSMLILNTMYRNVQALFSFAALITSAGWHTDAIVLQFTLCK